MLKNRINLLLELSGLSKGELAQLLNISDTYVSLLASGKRDAISPSLARVITLELGIPDYLNWLTTGDGDAPESVNLHKNDNDLVEVTIYDLAGAGNAYYNDDTDQIGEGKTKTDIKLFPRDLVKDCRTGFKVQGNSMFPLIRNGSYAGVSFDDKHLVSGDLYCLRLPYEGLVIKELQNEADKILVHNYNPEIKDYYLPHDYMERGLIVGRIKWIFSEII